MDNENESQDSAGAGMPVEDHSHNITYRDMIVDRTGELLEQAVNTAREFQRPQLTRLTEPGTGVEAIGIISPGEHGGKFAPVDAYAFDNFRDAPRRREGTAVMTRLPSFIAHVNRFKDSDSALFACDDPATPKLIAVLDYHEDENAEDREFEARPRFGYHRTAYAFPLSEEWQAWMKSDGEEMDMLAFAAFIEDRIVDVEAVEGTGLNDAMKKFIGSVSAKIATPTRLMELSRGLTIYEKGVVKDVRKLSSGEAQVAFESEHVDASGAPIDIPNLFVITIPVFANSKDFYRIAARLRYRKANGGIVFWYDLWRTELVFQSAFDEACAETTDKTGLPLFVGAPE